MSAAEWPLFPLGAVLMPGGPLMLRIFEPRYLDMVGRCMREETPFVVTLIHEGAETGPATFHDVGTLAKIVDWHQYEDGLLGITTLGQSRVRILDSHRQSDGLNVGTVEALPSEAAHALPVRYAYMARLLEQLIDQLGGQYRFAEPDYGDSMWVGFRLAEILPLSNALRQRCLEMTRPLQRLETVAEAIKAITTRDS